MGKEKEYWHPIFVPMFYFCIPLLPQSCKHKPRHKLAQVMNCNAIRYQQFPFWLPRAQEQTRSHDSACYATNSSVWITCQTRRGTFWRRAGIICMAGPAVPSVQLKDQYLYHSPSEPLANCRHSKRGRKDERRMTMKGRDENGHRRCNK